MSLYHSSLIIAISLSDPHLAGRVGSASEMTGKVAQACAASATSLRALLAAQTVFRYFLPT